MKKAFSFLVVILSSSFLFAGVFELFHPGVSYYECCNILSREIIGPFSLLSPPSVSRNTKSYDESCFFFYDEGRYMSYYIDGNRTKLMLYIDIYSFTYNFKTGETGSGCVFSEFIPPLEEGGEITASPLLSQVYSMKHSLLPSYYIEEQNDALVVIKSADDDIVITYREYDTFSLKTIEKGDTLVYARWVLATRKVGEERIPTREAFYLPFMNGDTIYIKETSTISGYGVDYGPFDYNNLPQLGEKLRSVL